MKLGPRQELFIRLVHKLWAKAWELGYEIRGGELQRTPEQQKIYIETGRSWTMKGEHLNKCAIDCHFTKNGEVFYPQELGDYWESLHPACSWGGNWSTKKDGPHFELRNF